MHKIIFIVLSLFATSSFATEFVDLYQSQSVVTDQQTQEQQRVSPDILRQVLLKVVGDRAALAAANLTPILSNVNSFIQRTEYRRLLETPDNSTQSDKLALALTFDESAVNQALTNNGLPIWSKSRPDVLVWLAIKDGQTSRILAADDENVYNKTLEQAAAQRGLPILLPIMDLHDQSQLNVDDLWTGLVPPIEQATQRYGAKTILLARVTVLANEIVQIDWQSIINGATEQWQSKGEIKSTLQAGIDEFTDRLSRDFTQVVTSQDQNGTTAVEISNVRDYADYSRTMSYFRSLQYVSDLQMVSLENEKLVITLQIKGDKSVFLRTLAIEHFIEQDSTNSIDQDKNSDIEQNNNNEAIDVMHYRLMP
jgi:hypothetical protein